MSKWHIWAIHQHKYDAINYFIETDVPEIEEAFFPTVLREKKVGNRVYKSRKPLYHGYLFLKYSDDDDSSVFYKLRSNPFITTYVGVCSGAEVAVMQKKEEWNVLKKEVEAGNSVEIMCGPLAGNRGVVEAINGNRITIKTKLFGREVLHILSADDIDITGK